MRKHFFYMVVALIILLNNSLWSQSGNKDYQYALIEAVKQKNIGNIPGAIELYKMVLGSNDSVAVAHYELGTLLALTKNYDDAIIHLQKANNLDPENKWYLNSYLDVLMNAKKTKLAIRILNDAIKKEPENVDYTFRLANAYFIAGKTGKAIRVLDKIENEKGVSDRIILMKANIYEQKKKYDKALKEVNIIIDAFPESVEFRVIAAELALKNKDTDLAMKYYSDVFEIDSSNIFAITNLTDYYRNKNDIAKSFFYLNKSFDSDEIDYSKKMAILSYYLSDKTFFNNHADLIQSLIVTLLNKYPDKREIHLFATDFFIQTKNYKKALDALLPLLNNEEQRYELWRQGLLLANVTNRINELYSIALNAYNIFPDSSEVIYFKGAAEYELNKYEEVLKTFSKVSLANISDSEIVDQSKILLAETYFKLDNFVKSDSIFRELIKEDPDNYLVINNFSYYLSLRGESLEEARELSYKTIENDSLNGTFLDTYAWILYKLNRLKEAEQYIIKAIKYGGGNDSDVIEHAAEINKALGKYNIAREYYQKAILLGGDKKEIITKLEEIQGKNE